MRTLQTPSAEHTKFDQLCGSVDEFGHLPDHLQSALAPDAFALDRAESGDPDEAPLDELILAGLVSPV